MTVYVGASTSSLVAPGQLYRLTFRNRFNPFSLTFWGTWQESVTRFVENLPGGGYAFVIGTPSIVQAPEVPVWQEVAVAVVRVAMSATAGASQGELALGDWVAKVHEAFPGSEIERVEKITGAVVGATDSALALEDAAERAKEENDPFAWLKKLGDQVKTFAGVLVLVAFVALLIYAGRLGGDLRKRLTGKR